MTSAADTAYPVAVPKIDRRVAWQRKHSDAGRCPLCGKPRPSEASLCVRCLVRNRERKRRSNGWQRRYKSRSYALEEELKESLVGDITPAETWTDDATQEVGLEADAGQDSVLPVR